jgi:hypothetical protein
MSKFDKPRRTPAPRSDYGDPYQRAQRPARATRDSAEFAPRPRRAAGEYVPRPRRDDDGGERATRGFTVTLDPDVARVFRGDASVNKALRLVLQLMQVVQGPPPRPFGARSGEERGSSRPPARRGYQGSDEARGFKRKPRFGDDE